MTKKIKDEFCGQTFERKFAIKLENLETRNDKSPVMAILSSEMPVKRWGYQEVLEHTAQAIDLSRDQGNGFPMLYNHSEFIGRLRDVEISESRLSARLDFSERSELAQRVQAEIRDGLLDSMSIGYRINEIVERSDSDIIRVTDWTLLEASVVDVPADPSATVQQRNARGNPPMSDEKGLVAPQGPSVIDIKAANRAAHQQGTQAGVLAEAERQREIRAKFERHAHRGENFRNLMMQCLDDSRITAARAADLLLDMIGEESAGPLGSSYLQSERGGMNDRATEFDIRGGRDELEKFAEGVEISLRARSITATREIRDAARRSEFNGWSLLELGREHARRSGRSFFSQNDVVRHMLRAAPGAGQGVGAFPAIVENIATKELLTGFASAEETFAAWTTSVNLPDFKQASLINLSQVPDLEIVQESGEFVTTNLGDIKETITLDTYGIMVALTRQVIINDDADAFTRIPANAGRAAARKVGDLAYNVLTSNPTMGQDAVALFNAAHSNLVASGSGAPTVARVEAARVAMKTQTDPKSVNAGIMPGYLIVPVALGGTARTLMTAEYDPAGTAGTLTPNSVRGLLTVVEERRLDADSATAWYVAARNHPTVVIGYLNGQDQPFLDAEEGFSSDGIRWKVRMDAAAAAADYRGLYKDVGTA